MSDPLRETVLAQEHTLRQCPGKRGALANAGRQRRHYERQQAVYDEIDALLNALTTGFERGRCCAFLDNLPEDRRARLREVTRRLEGKKLIACQREDEG